MYAVHSVALALLPYVRPNLYETARIKLKPWILTVVGMFSCIMMLIMSFKLIVGVFPLLTIWVIVGTVIYLIGRWKGKQNQFDYNGLFDSELKAALLDQD